MRKTAFGLAGLAAAVLAVSSPQAQETVKIGLILPYTGQFADPALQMDNGIKLFVAQHGATVAGKRIEIIRKDSGGIYPDVARRLARELVVQENVDLLAGFALTPNALAVADVATQSQKFMVNMNAATAMVTTKSPYMVRTSFTLPQLNQTLGTWAYRSGIRKIYTLVSDFSPGHDAEASFHKGFKEAGGEIVGASRYPANTLDFAPYMQRVKDAGTDSIYIWTPGGSQPSAIAKALVERGIDPRKTKILGQGELTFEDALRGMGDTAIGIITALHYDYTHDSALNRDFVARYRQAYGRNPDMFSVSAYDGMRVIYEALKKTEGKTSGEGLIAAAKGLSFESPRGPIAIDPATRDIVQNVYIRRVEKVGNDLRNVEFEKVENVKDPFKAGMVN